MNTPTFSEVMAALSPGRYRLRQIITHLPAGVDSRELARMLCRNAGRIANGRQLTKVRTGAHSIYVVTALAAPAVALAMTVNEAIAAADEARREGIATGAVAGLLSAQHGIGMIAAQGTALKLLNALAEMGFTWREVSRPDAG